MSQEFRKIDIDTIEVWELEETHKISELKKRLEELKKLQKDIKPPTDKELLQWAKQQFPPILSYEAEIDELEKLIKELETIK